MEDVQNQKDNRGVTIQQVGVTDVVIPIEVKDKAQGFQKTIGTFQVSVDLPSDQRGTHMSRFIECLEDIDEPLSLNLLLMTILPDVKERLQAEHGMLQVSFPYFVEMTAPESGMKSKLMVSVMFSVFDEDVTLTVSTPIMTLCPCSKEISEYGAHNQRSEVDITIRMDGWVWIEELVETALKCASAPVIPLLKRPDEKAITEQAYDNPMFVEDVVREAKLLLERHPQITHYKVSVVNHESIHPHNAFAYVEGNKEKIDEN